MELALVYKDVIDYNTAVYFYFKQNAADELRISDWSSDVCSSDLSPPRCSLSSSRSPGPPAGWPTGSSCWSRSRRSSGLASSTRAWPSATTSASTSGPETARVYAVTIVDGALEWREHPDPEPGAGEVVVAVRAAGLNGADRLQVAGLYPAPEGSPADIPGLELAGEVLSCGQIGRAPV